MQAIEPISQKQLRQFGFLVGGIFAGVFGLLFPFLKHRPLPPVPLAVGIALILLGAAAPTVLRPIYRGWMIFGGVLGKINGSILLSLIFFLFIFPLGLIHRMKGKDPMRKGFDPKAASYRIPSTELPAKNMEEVF